MTNTWNDAKLESVLCAAIDLLCLLFLLLLINFLKFVFRIDKQH